MQMKTNQTHLRGYNNITRQTHWSTKLIIEGKQFVQREEYVYSRELCNCGPLELRLENRHI